jgi:non-ribosomal peptide synthase protein (TIGR01720 family)
LSEVAGRVEVRGANPDPVTGVVPLTPIQRWFFSQQWPERHHYNHSLLLELLDGAPLTEDFKAIAAALHLHHDALRLRFVETASGWRQTHAAPDDPVCFEVVDLVQSGQELNTALDGCQRRFCLARGPLWKAVIFKLADGGRRLLLCFHHLVIDGVSWRVFLEDLLAICQLSIEGKPLILPPKSTSFKDWALELERRANGPEFAAEVDFWISQLEGIAELPADRAEGENTLASLESIHAALAVDETHALLHRIPTAYRTNINEILLAALARTMAVWTGRPGVAVELEGHGREPFDESLDLSRTMGWFTSKFPVFLDPGFNEEPGEIMAKIKFQLRALPGKGLGYGLLRYLNGEHRERFAGHGHPAISFNYLGQADAALPETDVCRPARESCGREHGELGCAPHELSFRAMIHKGKLNYSWTYSSNRYHAATIQSLADDYGHALAELISHYETADPATDVPDDFPDVELDRDQLAKILARVNATEDDT